MLRSCSCGSGRNARGSESPPYLRRNSSSNQTRAPHSHFVHFLSEWIPAPQLGQVADRSVMASAPEREMVINDARPTVIAYLHDVPAGLFRPVMALVCYYWAECLQRA